MPAEYRYDPATRLLRIQFSGVLTDDDVIQLTRAVSEDQRIGPNTRELVDTSGMDRADISLAVLLTVVALKCSHGARLDGHKLAVVAPNAVLSRMVRLYRRGSRIAGLPSEVRSFDTPAEATAWLDASG